jgi:hypothetical protein
MNLKTTLIKRDVSRLAASDWGVDWIGRRMAIGRQAQAAHPRSQAPTFRRERDRDEGRSRAKHSRLVRDGESRLCRPGGPVAV